VKLVVEKRRAALLTDILDYIRVNYSHDEAAAAVLKSAYPLDLEVVEEIKQKLEAKTGKRLYFYQHLDATILGGVQVTIGNTIIDGSLRKRLDDLKEKIDMLMVG
jgi:F-type H+-transporting ATPase subunit delta